jgi:recombinational DNA repair ATPase RecF
MNQPITSGNMSDLEKQYKTLLSQYNTLLDQAKNVRSQPQADRIAEQLKTLNVQLASVLDRMIAFQSETPSQVRDELVKRLAQIQRDYNGLLVSTDTLTTLRTIRANEGVNQYLSLYLIAFIALAVLLLAVIFWKGSSQTSDSTATTPTSPAVMTALT